MDPSFARTYYESATADHWWFAGRREMVAGMLARHRPRPRSALDIGAGTSSLFPPDLTVVKADIILSEPAAPGFVVASAERLPFASSSFDTVGLFDVLEHIDDPVGALAEASRVVRPTGCLVLTVPAHRWLWSRHDELVGHVTRYDRKTLVREMAAGGWRADWIGHFYAFLLPVGVARKLVGASLGVRVPPRSANRLLEAVALGSARRSLRRQRPLGMSIAAMATRAPGS